MRPGRVLGASRYLPVPCAPAGSWAVFRHDGWVKEARDAFPKLTPEAFKGSPIETESKKLPLLVGSVSGLSLREIAHLELSLLRVK
jgi:hypothetical protein